MSVFLNNVKAYIQAIAMVDAGHVIHVLKYWYFAFWGASQHNYMQECVELTLSKGQVRLGQGHFSWPWPWPVDIKYKILYILHNNNNIIILMYIGPSDVSGIAWAVLVVASLHAAHAAYIE